MSERDLAQLPGFKAYISRQPAELEKKEVLSAAVQRSPVEERTCRPGAASCGAVAGALARAPAAEPATATTCLRCLQRQYGNRFVQRLLSLSRQADGESDAASPAVQRAIDGARGGGQALDSTVQRQMGRAFNADFSNVRVHTGTQADGLNRSLNARAFTTGQDVFFRHGEYNPGSSSGRLLLAHELTHVMQQNPASVQSKDDTGTVSRCSRQSAEGRQGTLQAKLTVSRPGDIYEQEADRMAQAYTHWERGSAGAHGAEAGVQRKTPEEEEKEKQMAVHRKLQDGALQRQPEEEKKEEGTLGRLEANAVQRQGEAEKPEET